jgi:O-antigen biosynthesis protein
MRYTIITPTILRSSLLIACESVNNQTCKDWEHIVIVDCDMSSDIIEKIAHPQRRLLRCNEAHRDWGHTCVHNVWIEAKGDYVYRLDDDNYLADKNVLEDLKIVTLPWAIFPILRLGKRFFYDPPGIKKTDSGSFLVRRDVARFPGLSRYDADGVFVEELEKKYPYQSLGDMRPLMVMPSSAGELPIDVENEKIIVSSKDLKVSIFTPSHSNEFLLEAYESIKDQDFYEWIIVFNNGGIPTNFNDPRVKPFVLYKSPEMVGPLKAYACEQATGDILLELDHDDMLMPGAIEEVKKAFADPEVGFVYSNNLHATADLGKFPRYSETYGWSYRESEYKGHKLDEFVSFPPTPESISRIWFGPDHLRAFRRSIYNQIGGYDKTMTILDDSDIVCRMYIASKFVHIDKALYVYRVHGKNSWLIHNQEIQEGVYKIYDKYIGAIVRKWALMNDKPCIEVKTIEDLLKMPDNSAAGIETIDSFASMEDPVQIMKEVSRVLIPGGWLFCQVPSTDGRGAFQDPRHVSFWNENSFLYYTNLKWSNYIGTPVRFQAIRLYTTEKNNEQVCWVIAHLINLKDGYRPAGLLEI